MSLPVMKSQYVIAGEKQREFLLFNFLYLKKYRSIPRPPMNAREKGRDNVYKIEK